MTWQKVKAVQANADLEIQIGDDAHEVANAQWGDRPTYTLEKKNGDTWELTSFTHSIDDNVQLAKDVAEALTDSEDVWVNVEFGNETYVSFWAEGAPWDGGEVHDDYGIMDMS